MYTHRSEHYNNERKKEKAEFLRKGNPPFLFFFFLLLVNQPCFEKGFFPKQKNSINPQIFEQIRLENVDASTHFLFQKQGMKNT